MIFAGCSHDPDPVIEGKVVVLMYHRISEGVPANLYERSMTDFEADLRYLNENKIRVIGFEDLEEMVDAGVNPGTHCAIITFDDGDHSWLTRAMPLLLKYEMKGTFFLWTSMIYDNRYSFLSWDEIEYMSHYRDEDGNYPFIFGSHTLYHQYLLSKKESMSAQAFAEYLDEELDGSKRLIEAHTAVEVNTLSLPFGNGAGDEDIIAGAVRAGYKFIRTSEWNVVDPKTVNLFRIPSLPILSESGIEEISTYLDLE